MVELVVYLFINKVYGKLNNQVVKNYYHYQEEMVIMFDKEVEVIVIQVVNVVIVDVTEEIKVVLHLDFLVY